MSVADRLGRTERHRTVQAVCRLRPAARPGAGRARRSRRRPRARGLIATTSGATSFTLFVIGLALGLVLFHSRFGFTSAWRQLVAVGQGKALRAHMLMLAVACTLFAPVLAGGVTLAGPATPSLAPVGTSLFVGSFLFGVGMQLGGSCASGTLFAIGSGQTAILITLAGFVAGSVLGAYHFTFWTQDLPTGTPVSLADTRFGYLGAWVISLAVMGAVVGRDVRWSPVVAARPPSSSHRPPVAPRRAVRGRGRSGWARCCWPG